MDVLWIGTERGVYTYDKKRKKAAFLLHDPSDTIHYRIMPFTPSAKIRKEASG
jgi:ligand-binding sensor domain-containing protein